MISMTTPVAAAAESTPSSCRNSRSSGQRIEGTYCSFFHRIVKEPPTKEALELAMKAAAFFRVIKSAAADLKFSMRDLHWKNVGVASTGACVIVDSEACFHEPSDTDKTGPGAGNGEGGFTMAQGLEQRLQSSCLMVGEFWHRPHAPPASHRRASRPTRWHNIGTMPSLCQSNSHGWAWVTASATSLVGGLLPTCDLAPTCPSRRNLVPMSTRSCVPI